MMVLVVRTQALGFPLKLGGFSDSGHPETPSVLAPHPPRSNYGVP